MPTDDGVVETMRTWNPGVAVSAGVSGYSSSAAVRGNSNSAFKHDHDATAMASETTIAGGRTKTRASRMTSPLRGRRVRDKGGARTATAAGVNAPLILSPPPPPLMDVHARLRGSVLSPSPSPSTCFLGNAHQSAPVASGGSGGGAIACPPMGLEPTGVERLGSHYSPAAQALYLDLGRGRLAWRDADGAGSFRPGSVEVSSSGGPGGGYLESPESPWVQQRKAVESSRASRVWSGMDSRIIAAAAVAAGHCAGGEATTGGPPAATMVLPAPANPPSGFDIDGSKDTTERKEPSLSPSSPTPSSPPTARETLSDKLPWERKHNYPVAPSDPRGSGTTPRISSSGFRLTHGPGEALLSADRNRSSFVGEGESGGADGVAQTPDVGRAGSGIGIDGAGHHRGSGAGAVVEFARAVRDAESEERHQAGFTRYGAFPASWVFEL